MGTVILIPVTNLLERLFVEERRRLKIIPNAFGERAVLKLMFGALIRAAERWKSIKVTEFDAVSSPPSRRSSIRNTRSRSISIKAIKRCLHNSAFDDLDQLLQSKRKSGPQNI